MAARHLPRRHPARPAGRWRSTTSGCAPRYDRRSGTGSPLDPPSCVARDGRLPGHGARSPSSASTQTFAVGRRGRRRSTSARSSRGAPSRPRLYDATVASTGRDGRAAARLPRRSRSRATGSSSTAPTVIFRGMNRHETHPVRGRVFDEDHARADLVMMKQANVNAIRTSHYPPHPRVLDLADELGLLGDRRVRPGDPRLRLRRLARQPERRPARGRRPTSTGSSAPSSGTRTTRAWSSGRSATRPAPGATWPRWRSWVHRRDPERPVHYEGDYTGAYTDVYSRMYPNFVETAAIGGGAGPDQLPDAPAEAAGPHEAVPALRVRARDGQRPGRADRVRRPGRAATRGCTAASSGSGATTGC